MAAFDRKGSVMRACPQVADRLVFDADLSSHPLDEIKCGIVFIHAFWAGSSYQTLKAIGGILARLDPDGYLAFIVCDLDEIQQLLDWQSSIYNGDWTGGNGDLLWVANGVIQARHNSSRQCDFAKATQRLMLECQADGDDA